MSWRTVQLNQNLCDQDKIILDLFNGTTVKYVGHDDEFKKLLSIDTSATNLVLILNSPMWCSDIVSTVQTHLTDHYDRFYIGANRYTILGNDTQRIINSTGNIGTDYLQFI